jgi:DNA-directed RNA polymerase subunit RPC12/RpoP
MAGVVQSLEDLSRKGADLLIQCRACGHDRTVLIDHALDIFRRRHRSTDWWQAHRRFRCRKCGSKDICKNADFYGHAVRRQRAPAALAVVKETLRLG